MNRNQNNNCIPTVSLLTSKFGLVVDVLLALFIIG